VTMFDDLMALLRKEVRRHDNGETERCNVLLLLARDATTVYFKDKEHPRAHR
jgi:hypothetical protein